MSLDNFQLKSDRLDIFVVETLKYGTLVCRYEVY